MQIPKGTRGPAIEMSHHEDHTIKLSDTLYEFILSKKDMGCEKEIQKAAMFIQIDKIIEEVYKK